MLSVPTAGQRAISRTVSCILVGASGRLKYPFKAQARDEALGISKKRDGAPPLRDNPLLCPPPIRSAAACSPKPESAKPACPRNNKPHTVFSRSMPPGPLSVPFRPSTNTPGHPMAPVHPRPGHVETGPVAEEESKTIFMIYQWYRKRNEEQARSESEKPSFYNKTPSP